MSKTVHWSIVWSDLMMTMFIFFTVMYIFYSSGQGGRPNQSAQSAQDAGVDLGTTGAVGVRADERNGPPIPGKSQESMSDLYDRSKRTVETKDLKEFASVDLVPDKAVRIILTGDLLFDTGKAYLKPHAAARLQQVAEILRGVPYMVNVVGHTDDVPIHSVEFPTNWELSSARACAVARFLMESMEIPQERFYVTGHAYYQPVRPNNSDRNRAANRRVEIIITKERPQGMPERGGVILETRASERPSRSAYDRWPWNTF
jgi:chemotaxis protein MotB